MVPAIVDVDGEYDDSIPVLMNDIGQVNIKYQSKHSLILQIFI